LKNVGRAKAIRRKNKKKIRRSLIREFRGRKTRAGVSALAGCYLKSGRGLFLYDLATTAKLEQQFFSESVAYTHFSADGNRLLVLTRHQVAYVLDLSSVRAARPSGPPQP
jgi:hypothetical protein